MPGPRTRTHTARTARTVTKVRVCSGPKVNWGLRGKCG